MARAEDVAKYIIDIFTIKADHGFDDGMTNLRLQKLLYLAQGYSLAIYDKPLFPEAIEAWKYGPVVPTVYSRYNKFNRGVIHDDPPDQGALTDEDAELVLDVLSAFGKYSTGYLVDLSHKPDAPWAQVYNESTGKMRFEEQRYWSIDKRLARWVNKSYAAADTVAAIRLKKTKAKQAQEQQTEAQTKTAAAERQQEDADREAKAEESRQTQMLTEDYIREHPDSLMAKIYRQKKNKE